MKLKLAFLALACALFFSAQASATTIGIASFLDRDNQGTVFSLDIAGTVGELSAITPDSRIRLNNLNVSGPGGAGNDVVDLTVTNSAGDSPLIVDLTTGITEAGVITFTTRPNNGSEVLLRIEFDQANFSTTSFTGTENPEFIFELASDITFSGSIIDAINGNLDNETFSFGLIRVNNGDSIEFRADFTSGAEYSPVPVPAALPLMFSGLLGGLLFGRKKAAA